MITSNFKKIIRWMMASSDSMSQYMPVNVVNYFNGSYDNMPIPTSGNNLEAFKQYSYMTYQAMSRYATVNNNAFTPLPETENGSYYNGIFILCGSGNTAATTSDYKLESPLTTLNTVSGSLSMRGAIDYSKYLNIVSATFVNNSTSVVTVNEVGLYCSLSSATAQAGNSNFLIAREVLSSPVTLQPKETFTFTFNI